MVGLIPIYKEDLFDVKIEIYHQIIKVITKDKYNKRYPSGKFSGLCFKNWPDIIALKSTTVKTLLIICADRNA